jgi:hypothetical protein
MPSVDTQSRLSKNNSDLGLHNSTGSSSPNFDLVRNLSQSRELREQDVIHKKDITQENEIQQVKDKHQEFDLVRDLSQSRELWKQDVIHKKDISQDVIHKNDITQEKELHDSKGSLKEFYTWSRSIVTEWTRNMATGWTRNMMTERWSILLPTMLRTGISEQGHEQSQERGKAQPFSGRRVLHPLKALLVAGLLFTSGDIQRVEAGWLSRSPRVYKKSGWFGRSEYQGRGYVKKGWFGGKYAYSSSWFGRGKYLGRAYVKRGWFGGKYIQVRRRRWLSLW